MQSPFTHNQPLDSSEFSEDNSPAQEKVDVALPSQITLQQPFQFRSRLSGCMTMYSDAQRVGDYLNEHQGWFCRCAQPMKVESLGDNGYTLIIGCFGALGYEVEPKIAVILSPPEGYTYRMHSVPVPDYATPGYEVEYQASLTLQEDASVSPTVTQVEWEMDLNVTIEFPKFIYRLPQNLVQTTGERLLGRIVRQVSRRLTKKVQEDFHSSLGLTEEI